MIPFYRPNITEEDIQSVGLAIQTGHLVSGDTVRQFEEEFAKFIGAPYCVAVSSLTMGWGLVLDMLEPEAVAMPTVNYLSMPSMAKTFGARIIFTDEWHVGESIPMQTDRGLVMDSAHLVERNMFQREPEAIWLFSFHATKVLTTMGAGGMIATGSLEQANHLRLLRNDGRINAANGYQYVIHKPGWTATMTEPQAAMGLSQLKRLDETIEKRKQVSELYKKHLKNTEKDRFSQYLTQVWVENLDGFKKWADGTYAVSHHFSPLHKQPAFRVRGECPKTTEMSAHLISLPFYTDMTEDEVKIVADSVNLWRGFSQK